MHTGGCLCGAIRYRIEGPLAPIQLCHCGQCRKAQGGPFASNIPVSADSFEMLQGGAQLSAYESSPGKRRWFCGDCGSPLYSESDAIPGVLRLRAGTLDSPVESRPASHAYVASKADWWTINDELPQHPGARPG